MALLSESLRAEAALYDHAPVKAMLLRWADEAADLEAATGELKKLIAGLDRIAGCDQVCAALARVGG